MGSSERIADVADYAEALLDRYFVDSPLFREIDQQERLSETRELTIAIRIEGRGLQAFAETLSAVQLAFDSAAVAIEFTEASSDERLIGDCWLNSHDPIHSWRWILSKSGLTRSSHGSRSIPQRQKVASDF
jgi:hypothetical protein